ncbi:DNA-binding protein [Paraburkholderia sacchari]
MPLLVQSLSPGLSAVAKGRDTLPTDEAAPVINRKAQTLRKWACLEIGPIRPVRINGRLAWRVSDLQKLLNGEVA